MDEAYSRGQLPSVAVSLQAAGEKDIHHVAVILLEAPFGRRDSPGNIERLGNKRGESFHQHAGNEGHEHEVYVCVEGANPRPKVLVVEPWRFFKTFEEIAQGLWRMAQNLIAPLYPSPDKPVQIVRRHRGEFLHNRVQRGIACGGMLDVVVGHFLVVAASLRIPLNVRRRWMCHPSISLRFGRRVPGMYSNASSFGRSNFRTDLELFIKKMGYTNAGRVPPDVPHPPFRTSRNPFCLGHNNLI